MSILENTKKALVDAVVLLESGKGKGDSLISFLERARSLKTQFIEERMHTSKKLQHEVEAQW